MNNIKRMVSCVLVFSLLLAVVPINVFADVNSNTDASVLKNKSKKFEKDTLEELFKIIENTPDSVLESMSEKELLEYFNKQSNLIKFKIRTSDSKNDSNDVTTNDWWQNTRGGGAILIAVGGVFFAGAQLVKLKKYVKALGGAKEAAYLIYLYFHYGEVKVMEVEKNLFTVALELAGIITGVADVEEACGHLFSTEVY